MIVSHNGLSHVRHQAIIWSNDDLLPIGPLATKFCEIRIKMQQFPLKQMFLKYEPKMTGI